MANNFGARVTCVDFAKAQFKHEHKSMQANPSSNLQPQAPTAEQVFGLPVVMVEI